MNRAIAFIDLTKMSMSASMKAVRSLSSPLFGLPFVTYDSIIKTDFGFKDSIELLNEMYSSFEDQKAKLTFHKELNVFLYDISDMKAIINQDRLATYIDHEFSGSLYKTEFTRHKYIECLKEEIGASRTFSVRTLSGRALDFGCFKCAAVGGTFNYAHSGHKILISVASLITSHLYLGVTSDEILSKKSNSEYMEAYNVRQLSVGQFLSKFNKNSKIEYGKVESSKCGSDRENLEALVATSETEKGLGIFTESRREIGLSPVESIIIDVIEPGLGHSATKVSSSTVRALLAEKCHSIEHFRTVRLNLDAAIAFFIPQLGSDDLGLIFSKLAVLYSESHRFYHTLEHISECIEKLSLHFKPDITPEDFHTLVIALAYHDVIYRPSSKTNEEDSVAYFESDLAGLLPEAITKRVVSLILSTKEHFANPNDKLESILVDIDMSIIAEKPDRYLDYARAIRREYCIFPDADYKKARKEFLMSSLQKKQMFVHDSIFRPEDVKRNLELEISKLLE
jgi:predicted metal-dependent HD superfamily phosphohydrolase/phosphopantetheine adenylyltransferase